MSQFETQALPEVAPPDALYVIRLRVENANIVSSHLTWGFPAPTAFTGFAHALQLKLNKRPQYADLKINGVGIVSHSFNPQVNSTGTYSPLSLNLSRHPLLPNGNTAAMIEEGKGHLELSLILGLSGSSLLDVLPDSDEADATPSVETRNFMQLISDTVAGMRLAGGSVFLKDAEKYPAALYLWPTEKEKQQKLSQRISRTLLPGFGLLNKSHLLPLHRNWLETQPGFMNTQKAVPTLLDALLDIVRLNYQYHEPAKKWQIRARPEHLQGWLVPLPVGYGALTETQPAGSVAGARDMQCPVTFVEPLLGLGEWQGLHRVQDISRLLWAYQTHTSGPVYEVYQPYNPLPDSTPALAQTDGDATEPALPTEQQINEIQIIDVVAADADDEQEY